MRKILMVVALSAFCLPATLQAQEEGENALPSLAETEAQTSVNTADTKTVFLLICESDPQLLCVLDNKGNWINEVRSAKINFTIGEGKPQIECTMWAGPFKPSKPKVITWDLIQIKSIDKQKFQTIIDSLQSDPSAVRKMITNNNL